MPPKIYQSGTLKAAGPSGFEGWKVGLGFLRDETWQIGDGVCSKPSWLKALATQALACEARQAFAVGIGAINEAVSIIVLAIMTSFVWQVSTKAQ